MHRLYSSQDAAFTQYLKQLLEAAGIACVIRNTYLSGAAGELPVNETWPELWLLSEADRARAERIVAEATQEGAPAPDWICPRCGERVEGQFGRCWNCGAEAPE